MGCKSCNKPITKPKPKLRRGLWSPDEDQRLSNYILQHGHGCWSSVPTKAGDPETSESAPAPKESFQGSSSVPQVFDCHPPEQTHQSSFPKLLFTEWLSSDHVHCQNLVNSGEPADPRVIPDGSNLNDALGYGLLLDEGPFASEFSSPFKFENQFPESEFFDFDSMGEICGDFNMTNGVNYL
ncbi:hypothetical protein HHK36_028908 [Tetracentron sinense]|uniref:Uncharacterized protein n=1 Tax=Tetracentron sinense TaxID=13715 RepID=A0A834YGP6_TETSI|nr:hypothetical protein HHK36_028908 [Tetracentron sinense]